MNKQEQVQADEARMHLMTVSKILGELGQDKAAAKVLKIADKLPIDQFEDGLYRIDGAPWERLDGEWSSTRFRQTEANDADVVARYGNPVRVREAGPHDFIYDRSALPKSRDLNTLLSKGGYKISYYEVGRVRSFIEALESIENEGDDD